MRKGKDLEIQQGAEIFRIRLEQVMAHDQISKRELARKLDVTYQAVSQFLGGNSMPSLATGIKIAKVLDVSLDWLCGLGE